MSTVKLQVLVRMRRLPEHMNLQTVIFTRTHQRIQKRDCLSVRHRFLRELQVPVDHANVTKEALSHQLLDDDKGIIHVVPPNPGR